MTSSSSAETNHKSTITTILELVQSLVAMYFEVIKQKSMGSMSQISDVLIRLIVIMLIGASLFTTIWLSLLGLLFSSLQAAGWEPCAIWLCLLAVNGLSLIIVAIFFSKTKQML